MSNGENPPIDLEAFRRAREENEWQNEDEPEYVELFDVLVENALRDAPQEVAEYAKTRPEFSLSFGEQGRFLYYIKLRLQQNGELAQQLTWLNPTIAATAFYFFITNEGSLIRNITLSTHVGDSPKNQRSVITDLGTEAGEQFAQYILGKPWEDKEAVLSFCQLLDDEKLEIDEIYKQFKLHHIGKTAVDDTQKD